MTQALILKITVKNHQPLSWRQLAVPITTTYSQLHQLIRVAFGWNDALLYAFRPEWNQDLSYEDVNNEPFPGNAQDGMDVQILPDLQRGTVQYTLDFDKNWIHQVELVALQNIFEPLPRCLAGQGNGFDEESQLIRPGQFNLVNTNAEVMNTCKSDIE